MQNVLVGSKIICAPCGQRLRAFSGKSLTGPSPSRSRKRSAAPVVGGDDRTGAVILFLRSDRSDFDAGLREQESQVRRHLAIIGVDHQNAIVLKHIGPGNATLKQLEQKLAAGTIRIVAVSDLTRLGRGQPSIVPTLLERGVRIAVVGHRELLSSTKSAFSYRFISPLLRHPCQRAKRKGVAIN